VFSPQQCLHFNVTLYGHFLSCYPLFLFATKTYECTYNCCAHWHNYEMWCLVRSILRRFVGILVLRSWGPRRISRTALLRWYVYSSPPEYLVTISQSKCCKFPGALKQYQHAVQISEFALKVPSWLNADKLVWVISGFRRGVNEISLFWHVTQRRLVVSYRRFGSACQLHLQGYWWLEW